MDEGTSVQLVTVSGYTLLAPLLALGFLPVPAATAGLGRVLGHWLDGLVLALDGSILGGRYFLGGSTEEAERLARLRFPGYLFGLLLSSAGFDDRWVFDSIGLDLEELFATDAEVFF
jgi:hypothetical protein